MSRTSPALVVGATVRRNPRYWKNDKRRYRITRRVGADQCWIVLLAADGSIARCKDEWTGKMREEQAMPYLAEELVPA